jgi:hypothetical protein
MMNTSEYLESRAYVLENAGLEDTEVMDGLTPQALTAYLSQSCRSVADANSEVHLDTFRAILKETPKLRLTPKEVLIFEANFLTPKAIKISWEKMLPWAYQCLLCLRKECKIGRRIGLAALQCIRNGKMRDQFKMSLVEAAEHLLGVVKLQNKSGIIMATFPDAEKYYAAEVDSSLVGKKKVEVAYSSIRITVRNHSSIDSMIVDVNGILENIGIGYPTTFTLQATEVESAANSLQIMPCVVRIPSVAEVDDEVAQSFCDQFAHNVFAKYDTNRNVMVLMI